MYEPRMTPARAAARRAYEDAVFNPFVLLAHAALKMLGGAAFDGQPFMGTHIDREQRIVTCSCFYHTVRITPIVMLIFTNEAGGMCPPTLEYFEHIYRIDNLRDGWFDDYIAATDRASVTLGTLQKKADALPALPPSQAVAA
jgi:hypothetical protein